VIGTAIITGLVVSLLTTFVLLRVDPSTVLSSCSSRSPGPPCSSPVNAWGIWLPDSTGILGMAMVGTLLVLRRRGVLGPIPLPTKSN
jgi:hypothetical protein